MQSMHATTTHAPTPVKTPMLKVRTPVKSSKIALNHNETLVRVTKPPVLKVKTPVKAIRIALNHNETLVQATPRQPARV